jgi:acyl dehydratase
MEQTDNVIRVSDINSLRALVDAAPLKSDWVKIDQARVNEFADATGDHQWIHVDPERAARESPFGGPIAHGFLTLSLIVTLLGRTIELRQRAVVNYGLNRVRFTAPVRVGTRVRARFQVMNVTDVEGGGVQVLWDVTLDIEGGGKPACVAEFITRHYF